MKLEFHIMVLYKSRT